MSVFDRARGECKGGKGGNGCSATIELTDADWEAVKNLPADERATRLLTLASAGCAAGCKSGAGTAAFSDDMKTIVIDSNDPTQHGPPPKKGKLV